MSDVDLIRAAARIASENPGGWKAFVAELESRADDLRRRCVAAPPESVFVAQGVAREAAVVAHLLRDCLTTVNKLPNKKQ